VLYLNDGTVCRWGPTLGQSCAALRLVARMSTSAAVGSLQKTNISAGGSIKPKASFVGPTTVSAECPDKSIPANKRKLNRVESSIGDAISQVLKDPATMVSRVNKLYVFLPVKITG
jgi:hypothetical protein